MRVRFPLPAPLINMNIQNKIKEKIDQENIPFASFAVTNEHETVFLEHYGNQLEGEDKPPSNSTLYRIASMTKPIVTFAALKCVELGLIDLDKPVHNFHSDLKDLEVGKLQDGKVIYEKANKDITLHHLLAHTSGFAYDFHDPLLAHLILEEKIAPLTDKEGNFINVPLSYHPDSRWEYGVGLDWVGVIIEKLLNKNLEEICREFIFDPLGMNDTSFDPDFLGKDRLAEMHLMDNGNFIHSTGLFDDSVQSFFSGGGGILSNPSDYCKFMRIFLSDTNPLLSDSLTSLMTTNQIGDLNYSYQPTFNPVLVHGNEWFPEIKKKWGYGFLINEEDIPDRRKKGSLSWSGIFNTYFWIDPQSKIAGTVMMQLSPHYDEKCKGLLEVMEKAVYEEM